MSRTLKDLKEFFEFGPQYAAQPITKENAWIVFRYSKNDIKLTQDKHSYKAQVNLSFDVLTVEKNTPEVEFLCTIHGKDLLYPKEKDKTFHEKIKGSKKRRRGKKQSIPHIPFGIHVKVFSNELNTKIEGFLHHHFIDIINQIKAVNFVSSSFNPALTLSTEFLQKDGISLPNIFRGLSEIVKEEFIKRISQIEGIHMEIWAGKSEVKKARQDLDLVLKKKDGRITNPHDSESTTMGFVFDFPRLKAPFSPIVVTKNRGDPQGYLNYTDIIELFKQFPEIIEQRAKKIDLGKPIESSKEEYEKLSKFFRDLSYENISRVQLWGLDYPLPFSPNFDVLVMAL